MMVAMELHDLSSMNIFMWHVSVHLLYFTPGHREQSTWLSPV